MTPRTHAERFLDCCLAAILGIVIIIAIWALTSCAPMDAALFQEVNSDAVSTGTVTPSPSAAPIAIPSPTLSTCTVSTGYPAGRVNMRTGPGIQHAVIQILHEADVLTVLSSGPWLQVETGQHVTGWVNGRYCHE